MKKLLSLLLCLALLLSITGCHKARTIKKFDLPEEFDTSRQFTISFWAKNDTNQTQVSIYKKAIEDFQALYPNITVDLHLYTDYGRIYSDVITNIPTATTPNVCITYPDHIATYMTGGDTVVPLDSLFSHEKYGLGGTELRYDGPAASELIPQFLGECAFDSAHYAVPYMRSTEACYVNKTYVEKLGYTLPDVLTWDFVWEVSQAAMEQDATGNYTVNGQKVLIPFLYKSTDNMMIQMLKQKEAGYSTYAGEVEIFNDTTRMLLQQIGENSATGAFDTFKSVGYPANYLNAGQCIFAIDSTAGATWVGSDAPLMDIPEDKRVSFETVVMPVPQFDTANPQMISQGPSLCIFNKEDPQEVLASWLFTQFMLTNSVQIAYSQTEGYLPVTTKALESEEYQTYLQNSGIDNDKHYYVKLDAVNLLINNIDNTFVTPVFNGSTSLRNAAGQLIEEVKKSARRGETIDTAYFDSLFKKMSAQYHLDQIVPDPDKMDGSGQVAVRQNDLGPLPPESVILLSCLALAWVAIAIYAVFQRLKSKKVLNNH